MNIEVWILFLLVGILLGKAHKDYQFYDPLVDIYEEISNHYVEEPDRRKLLKGAIEGMIETLDDPHTNYLSPEDLAQFDKQTRGSFSGIGALIGVRNDQLTIISPLEDSPAFEAGVLAGDAILEINGKPTEGFTASDAVKLITGPEGSAVTLKVRHLNGETEVIKIERRKIKIQTVKGYWRDKQHHWDFMLDPEAKIGYVQLTQFSGPTADEMHQAIVDLKKQGMKGLILDLRFNPGGLLTSAVEISDMFLEKGTIVSTRSARPGREEAARVESAKKDPKDLGEFPMIVLINESSASASEIVSGALKDNGRAIILGTRSYGKGSVQQVRGLAGGNGAIKLTTAYYYLPSGRNLHRRSVSETWGVDPNDGFYVPMSFDQRQEMRRLRSEADVIKEDNGLKKDFRISPEWLKTERKDLQLAAALVSMRNKLDTGKFKPVGDEKATLQAHINERKDYLKRREQFNEGLSKINQKLKELDQKILKLQKNKVDAEKPADAADAPKEKAPAEPAPAN